MRNVESVLHLIRTYAGVSDYLAVFVICVIFLFYKADKLRRREIMIVTVLAVLLVFNNYAWRFVGKVMESSTYYRFMWMVPIVLLIAISVTTVIDKTKGLVEIAFVFLLVGAIVLFSGDTFFSKEKLQPPQTIYDVSEDLIQASDLIKENKKEDFSVVALDPLLMMESRVYDPTILWAVSYKAYNNLYRNGYYEKTNRYKAEQIVIEAVTTGSQGDSTRLRQALEKLAVDFLVIDTSFQMDAYLTETGCTVIGHTNKYTLYAYEVGKNE